MKNPNRSPVSKQRTAVSTNSKLKSVHQHLFFFCTVHPLFSLVSCSGRAASSRSMDSSWEFTLESHAKPVLASLWAPVDASLWAHTSTTLHLKKGHDTFRVYILHRDIRTERTRGDAYEFAPEAMHESVPEARPLPAQHSANHS